VYADPGLYLVRLVVDDGAQNSFPHVGPHGSFALVDVAGDAPPDCSGATVSPAVLWPPNHHLVPLTLSGATDPDGDVLTVRATGITQDEDVDAAGDGSTTPDAEIGPPTPLGRAGAASVRAERDGAGDGRVYQVTWVVSDGALTCTVTTSVTVPRSAGLPAVDTGQAYDSTAVVLAVTGSGPWAPAEQPEHRRA
jgi:hypothetical protein